MNSKDLPSLSTLTPAVQEKQDEILKEIVEEDDVERLKDLTHLFNAHATKRQVLRLNTLNDVQDALINQMVERLAKTPDNFANKDIADWMKIVQQVMESSQRNVAQVDEIPAIINQQNTQVNINITDGLSRESREKITEAIKELMQDMSTDEQSSVYIDETSTLLGDDEEISEINSEENLEE